MKSIGEVMRGQPGSEPANDNRPAIRPIKFPAPSVPSTATIGTREAGDKVRRAGAPADAIDGVRRLFFKEVPRSRAAEASDSWWYGMRVERPLLALLGPTGLGKTTAAAWAAFCAAREYPWNSQAGGGGSWEPIVWLAAADIALLQSWFDDGKRQAEESRRAWLLVIDDAGHEKERPAIAALTDLLMRRIDGCRATILTTNLRGREFAGRYGVPVVDRMKASAFVPELGNYESLRVRETMRMREPGED